ncbi:G-protein coupled receptor dmsr-1 isoform X2 [Phlebotomus papatasi]|uniref:G-protein coupled receptor dmsr-1 isoform X2 n=1 Tax=Phlebotomus papatasi TaxID=29031 RepID=UPI0024838446|nr:G-protein coupled receptor dmsr-1 isoform X2 [Phlebotomus papatasi]
MTSGINITELIQQHVSKFTGDTMMHPENAETPLALHQNLSKYLNASNHILSDYNITEDHVNEFVRLLGEIGAQRDCSSYCAGTLRNIFTGYRSFHGYISLVICIFGTIANILNIIVLTRKEMCKAPINIILKWLAVTDMIVMIEYIPFSTYMYLIFPGKREFKYSWAVYLLFHMHLSQILHTISISLTVTLAIWRYIAIKHPHGSFAACVLSHCNEAILISFILPPILCFPTYFVFRINEKTIEENNKNVLLYHLDAKEDTALYRFNFWMHSILIKLLPCVILTVISFVLIRVLYKAAKRKVKLKGYTNPINSNAATALNGTKTFCFLLQYFIICRPPRSDRRTDRTTMLLVAVLLLFLITEFPQGILGLLSGILQKCFLTRCYTLFGEMMDLLALINAAVGFVLYGLMSKQFRTSFKAVFFKHPPHGVEMTKVTGLTTTCV